jgi:hypothetical protein
MAAMSPPKHKRPKELQTTIMPPQVAALPRDPRGYPVFFAVYVDAEGTPDFRVTDDAKRRQCWRERRCGICGDELGYWLWFIGGERSVANRLFSDPPMHEDCARYAMAVCPFLARPQAKYAPDVEERADRLEEGGAEVHVTDTTQTKRPAHMALYRTRRFEVVQLPAIAGGGLSARAAPAKAIEWFPPKEQASEDHG